MEAESKLRDRLLEKLELYLWSTLGIDFNLRGFAGLELARNLRSKFDYLKSESKISVYGPTKTGWISDVIAGITKTPARTDKNNKPDKPKVKFIRSADPESVIQILDKLNPEYQLPAKTKFVVIRGTIKSELPLEILNLGYDTYTVLNPDEYNSVLKDDAEIVAPEINLQIDDFETIKDRISQ